MFKTVKSKVALIYISLVIIIVLLGAISLFNMTSISRTIDGLILTNYNSIIRLNAMEKALLELDRAVYSYLFGGDAGAGKVFESYMNIFMENYQNEDETIILPYEKVYIDEIRETYNAYISLAGTLLDSALTDEEAVRAAKSVFVDDLLNCRADVEEKIKKLFISNETALFERQDQAAHNARGSILILAVIFPTAALGGYLLATLYTKRFFTPLYEITQSVRNVREGNLSGAANVSGEDEFSMLTDEFNNMTQRLQEFEKNAIDSIESEKNKSDSIVRSINEPLLFIDKESRIITMNQAFSDLFEIDAETAEGEKIGECLRHSDFIEYAGNADDNSTVNEQSDKAKIIIVNVNDEALFFQIVQTPFIESDGQINGKIFVLHNITEIMLLEKRRVDFIATISHEFKTPLTSILMGGDILFDDRLGALNDGQHEVIETIMDDVNRLETLIDEMLELSKIESAKEFYEFKPCDIVRVIETSAKQFHARVERNNISLTISCPEDRYMVMADFSKITWVMNNLLSNAIKYSDDGGRIYISASRQGNTVKVSVADNGIGVPSEFADQIFEKFAKIKGYDVEIRGSGVGLAVSKEIIIAHDGQIWCENNLPTGSIFSFTIPSMPRE